LAVNTKRPELPPHKELATVNPGTKKPVAYNGLKESE
jgi:hypothetical protein